MEVTTSKYHLANGHQPDRQPANGGWILHPDTWLTLHALNYMPEAIIGLLSFYPKHLKNIFAPRNTIQHLRRTHSGLCQWVIIKTAFIQKVKKFRQQRNSLNKIYCASVFLRAVFLLRAHKIYFQRLRRTSEVKRNQLCMIEVRASLMFVNLLDQLKLYKYCLKWLMNMSNKTTYT